MFVIPHKFKVSLLGKGVWQMKVDRNPLPKM